MIIIRTWLKKWRRSLWLVLLLCAVLGIEAPVLAGNVLLNLGNVRLARVMTAPLKSQDASDVHLSFPSSLADEDTLQVREACQQFQLAATWLPPKLQRLPHSRLFMLSAMLNDWEQVGHSVRQIADSDRGRVWLTWLQREDEVLFNLIQADRFLADEAWADALSSFRQGLALGYERLGATSAAMERYIKPLSQGMDKATIGVFSRDRLRELSIVDQYKLARAYERRFCSFWDERMVIGEVAGLKTLVQFARR